MTITDNILDKERLIILDRKASIVPNCGYYTFFIRAWEVVEKRKLSDNWHIRYICQVLQEMVERVGRGEPKKHDLIVCVPPRCSKSSMVAVFLNAWAWIQWPHLKFLTISYSSGLSDAHSMKTKRLIESAWYQERWGDQYALSTKKNTNKLYHNTEGGERQASSVGGMVTGAGGDVIVADDLLNVEESHSEANRKTALRFYENTLYNRLDEPGVGVRILIQQRTHEDDVVGSLLRKQEAREDWEDNYKVIVLPASIESGQKCSPPGVERMYISQLLDPHRLPRHILDEYEDAMVDYSEQYDQSPKKPGGNVIKGDWFFAWEWEDLYARARFNNEEIRWMFEIDAAYKEKTTNDNTVVLAYCYLDGMIWLRNRLKIKKVITGVMPQVTEFVKANGYTSSSEVHVEPKASGPDLVQLLIKYAHINAIESFNPTTDKVARVHSILPFLKARRCGYLKGAHWWDDFIEECEVFPNGSHDDQVDTLVMAVKNGEIGHDVLASGGT